MSLLLPIRVSPKFGRALHVHISIWLEPFPTSSKCLDGGGSIYSVGISCWGHGCSSLCIRGGARASPCGHTSPWHMCSFSASVSNVNPRSDLAQKRRCYAPALLLPGACPVAFCKVRNADQSKESAKWLKNRWEFLTTYTDTGQILGSLYTYSCFPSDFQCG